MASKKKVKENDRPMTPAEAAAWATEFTLLQAWRVGDYARRHGEISTGEFYLSYGELVLELTGEESKYEKLGREILRDFHGEDWEKMSSEERTEMWRNQ